MLFVHNCLKDVFFQGWRMWQHFISGRFHQKPPRREEFVRWRSTCSARCRVTWLVSACFIKSALLPSIHILSICPGFWRAFLKIFHKTTPLNGMHSWKHFTTKTLLFSSLFLVVSRQTCYTFFLWFSSSLPVCNFHFSFWVNAEKEEKIAKSLKNNILLVGLKSFRFICKIQDSFFVWFNF